MHKLWVRPPPPPRERDQLRPLPVGGRGRWKVPEGQAARALGGPGRPGTAARQLPRNTATGGGGSTPRAPLRARTLGLGPPRPARPRRHLPPSVRFRPGRAGPGRASWGRGEGRGPGAAPAARSSPRLTWRRPSPPDALPAAGRRG